MKKPFTFIRPARLRLIGFMFCVAFLTYAAQAATLQVCATTTILGDVVHAIGGERITLSVLLPPGSDPHFFEPSPRDLVAVANADVVFINGAGLERFLPLLLKCKPARVVAVSEGMTLRHLPGNGEEDPHVWLDPQNVSKWVDRIASTLTELAPTDADYFNAGAAGYKQELATLDAWIQNEVTTLPVDRRVLVTDHDSFGYFADRYGFEVVGTVIPGFSTAAEPSARELAGLQDVVMQRKVRAVFTEPTTNPDLVQRVAGDQHIPLVVLYAGSLDEPGHPADSYIGLMRYNVNAMVSALKE